MQTYPPTSDARSGWSWPLWATISGIFGAVATAFSEQSLSEDVRGSGVAVIAELNHWNFQVGILTGLFATFALIAFAAGWQRWAEDNGLVRNLAARMIGLAMIASAGAMIIGYGFKGSLAVYLDGGLDGGSYPAENLLTIFMINDFAPWMCWWGVTFAVLGVIWLSFRDGALPKWFGAVAIPFALVPLGFVFATGLPGMTATSSLFMIFFGIAMAVRERRAATVAIRTPRPASGALIEQPA
jgi:hypothetical protein